ncbi:MAG: DUF554 domain-containing protein [Propionibacteriaceae bacterium]|nr:DUF554 domain-containing protein [Propionibacteriaceae bacterium]
MPGVVANVGTIIVGTIIGLLFGKVIPERFRQIAFWAMGLCTFGIAVVMIIGGYNDLKPVTSFVLLIPVISLVLGAIIGEALRIEQRLANLAAWLESRLPAQAEVEGVEDGDNASPDRSRTFVEGFMSASVLFCVGAMAILGSIQAGLGDSSILYLKALMDGIAAIPLACALGIGVGFSALPILILEGGVALLSMSLGSFFTPPILASIDLVGGMMMLAIGFDLTGIKKLRVANMLPAILIAIALGWWLG